MSFDEQHSWSVILSVVNVEKKIQTTVQLIGWTLKFLARVCCHLAEAWSSSITTDDRNDPAPDIPAERGHKWTWETGRLTSCTCLSVHVLVWHAISIQATLLTAVRVPLFPPFIRGHTSGLRLCSDPAEKQSPLRSNVALKMWTSSCSGRLVCVVILAAAMLVSPSEGTTCALICGIILEICHPTYLTLGADKLSRLTLKPVRKHCEEPTRPLQHPPEPGAMWRWSNCCFASLSCCRKNLRSCCWFILLFKSQPRQDPGWNQTLLRTETPKGLRPPCLPVTVLWPGLKLTFGRFWSWLKWGHEIHLKGIICVVCQDYNWGQQRVVRWSSCSVAQKKDKAGKIKT